jgi:hypothetical protein
MKGLVHSEHKRRAQITDGGHAVSKKRKGMQEAG